MKNKNQKWAFFIAYARADSLVAEKLADLLRPHKVFLDSRTILPGDNWGEELQRAQKESLISVILISSNTKSAYYQQQEVVTALEMSRNKRSKHRVIPIFLDEKSRKRVTPYGLDLKQALDASSAGGIEEVAKKLRETVRYFKKTGSDSQRAPTSKRTTKTKSSLVEAISKLSIDHLLSEVLDPLIETLHPGRVEYCQLSDGLPRSTLSFGQDLLGRTHVLCVQGYADNPVSTSKAFRELMVVVERARASGLRRENGSTCIPDEVWLVASHPWKLEDRQKVSDRLLVLATAGIKFVSAEELSSLVLHNLPTKASQLSKFSSPAISNLISSLSRHLEGRAFGFSADKDISEFYVTAALSPSGTTAYAALRGDIVAKDYSRVVDVPLNKLLYLDEIFKSDRLLESLVRDRAVEHFRKGLLKKYEVPVDVRLSEDPKTIRTNCIDYCLLRINDLRQPAEFVKILRNGATTADLNGETVTTPLPLAQYLFAALRPSLRELLEKQPEKNPPDHRVLKNLVSELNGIMLLPFPYSELELNKRFLSTETKSLVQSVRNGGDANQTLVLNRVLLSDALMNQITPNEYLSDEVMKITVTVRIEEAFKRLVDRTKEAVRSCPPALKSDVTPVRKAWNHLKLLESFTDDMKLQTTSNASGAHRLTTSAVRIRVPQPEHLLKLDNIVLVEGSPGCGKTTLLKILAVKMLTDGVGVFYLPCSIVSEEFRNAPLKKIIKSFAVGSAPKVARSTKQTVLIVDGLDEASFDFSTRILSHAREFQNVVVSTRNSYPTSIRDRTFRLALAPFDNAERDLFFEKWFMNDPALVTQAKDLIRTYPDIDIHTRLPLIATITVALLQNGMVPRTRAEIYGHRLDLLLSKWDRFRGVDRLYVDNPDAKRRFLRHLAFEVHSDSARRRQVSLEELKHIYENSLGSWGYKIDYSQLLHDLIVGSGVVIDEGGETYSLGHLTFQEHLAAEHLAETHSTERIFRLLGNDWWREPLNFYASIKGDITALIDYSMNTSNFLAHVRQLAEMAVYAPYTSPGANQIVLDSVRGITSDDWFDGDFGDE